MCMGLGVLLLPLHLYIVLWSAWPFTDNKDVGSDLRSLELRVLILQLLVCRWAPSDFDGALFPSSPLHVDHHPIWNLLSCQCLDADDIGCTEGVAGVRGWWPLQNNGSLSYNGSLLAELSKSETAELGSLQRKALPLNPGAFLSSTLPWLCM